MLSAKRKQKLESNIWKFYIYRVFDCAILSIPIFVLFYQSIGLSMTQIMLLQSIYTAAMMIAVVPAGILADYIGRKKVLVANAFVFTIAWVLFALSYNFITLMIAEIMVALAGAMWMASGTAFFYDTLKELNQEESFKKKFGNTIGISYAMWGVSALAGGYVALMGYRAVYWVTAAITFVALLISFTFTETKKYKHGEKNYIAHLKEAVLFSAKHPRVRLFIIYSAIALTVYFAVFVLMQPYLESIKVPLVYFGWIYMAMYLFGAVGSKFTHKIEEFLGEKKILYIITALMVLGCAGMAFGFPVLGAIFPIILFAIIGIFDTIIPDYLNKHIESHQRATVLSLQTLVSQLLTSVSAPFFGWIADFWSLKIAFVTAAIILAIDLIILIAVFAMIGRKKN